MIYLCECNVCHLHGPYGTMGWPTAFGFIIHFLTQFVHETARISQYNIAFTKVSYDILEEKIFWTSVKRIFPFIVGLCRTAHYSSVLLYNVIYPLLILSI